MGISSFVFRRLSFATRLEQLRPRIYRLAFSWCKDPFLADDLAQEAVARALQKQSQLRDPEIMDRWVIRILANLWMDHVRRSSREDNLDAVEHELSVDAEESPDCLHCREEMIERVRTAIARLPTAQRMVVTLVDLEEFSYKEVSSILDLPIGTVMSRLSRGRKALKMLLLEPRQARSEETGKTKRHLRRVV